MTDNSVKSSRFSRRRLFGSAVFTAAGLAVCFVVLVGKPQTQPTQFPEPRRPLVDVILAAPADHSISVRTQGTVEPVRRVGLVAQVSGKVESVSDRFLDGRFFKAGDILLQLEKGGL
jgi:multidrug efflux pump subunit AcrA (membrane-fusion protein)